MMAVHTQFHPHGSRQRIEPASCAMRFMANMYPDKLALQSKLEQLVEQLGPIASPAPSTPTKTDVLQDSLTELGNGVFERHPNTARRAQNLRRGSVAGFSHAQ